MHPLLFPAFAFVVIFSIVLLNKWINILREYERGVTFWLGKLSPKPCGPER